MPRPTGLWLALLLLGLHACAPVEKPGPPPSLIRLQTQEFPQFADALDYEGLQTGIEHSLSYLRRLPPETEMVYGADRYTASRLMHTLEAFSRDIALRPSPEALNNILRQNYWIYQAAGSDSHGTVLFTGYYEPLLRGSKTRSGQYPVPVHSRPADLVEIDLTLFDPDLKGRRIVGQYTGRTVLPYPDRAGLRAAANLDTLAPPIAWLADEVDLLILQIQGSGKIALPDGRIQNVRYDGSNGLPYRSVGSLLIDQGKISPKDMSMQAIRAYLRDHPQEAQTIVNHNPRYIFFKPSIAGPFGALNQPLTPMRSIAVDRGIFPSAALAFVTTRVPSVNVRGEIEGWEAYGGFALAQDAGSAIKGPGRVDLFWGDGARAEKAAGHLKHPGALYFLIRKTD